MFTSAMSFSEFPNVKAGVQVIWSNNVHLCAFLLFDYEPKLADIYNFKELINDLNDELWGVTFVWKEDDSQILAKFIEQPTKFSPRNADDFLEHIHEYGNMLLDRIYPRTEKEQAQWQENADQKLYLKEAPVAGSA